MFAMAAIRKVEINSKFCYQQENFGFIASCLPWQSYEKLNDNVKRILWYQQENFGSSHQQENFG